MICAYCGQENPETADICGFCGGPLLAPAKPPSDEAQPIEPVVEVKPSPEAEQAWPAPIPPPKPSPTGIYGTRIWWIVGCLVILCLILGCIALGWGLYRYSGLGELLNQTFMTPVAQLSLAATDTSLPGLQALVSNTPVIVQEIPLTQTPGFIPTLSQATPGLVFQDDFSDIHSGWDQVDAPDYSTNYYQGAYRILVNTEMSDSWANPPKLSLGNVRVEVEATKNGGPDDNDFGLMCRYLDIDRYYYAVVSSDGYFGIIKSTSESTEILGRDSLEYSDVIKQGTATNHIRFDCVGDELTLYINEQLLDQQTDGEYATGNVGLIAGSYNTPGTDILFDNFRVYAP